MAPGSMSVRSGAGRVPRFCFPIGVELAACGVFHGRRRCRRARPAVSPIGTASAALAAVCGGEQAACRGGVRRARRRREREIKLNKRLTLACRDAHRLGSRATKSSIEALPVRRRGHPALREARFCCDGAARRMPSTGFEGKNSKITSSPRETRMTGCKGRAQSPPFCFAVLHPLAACRRDAAYFGQGPQVPPGDTTLTSRFSMCRRSCLRRWSCCCWSMRCACSCYRCAGHAFLLTFAFIPARYELELWPAVVSRRLRRRSVDVLHLRVSPRRLLHIGLNLAWLLPFGTALARRFGAWRYCAFMLVTAAAGAFAHLISHPGAMVPMIGASAAISGAMAAAMRFVFQQRRSARPVAARPTATPIACRLRRLATLARSPVSDFPRRLARTERAVRARHGVRSARRDRKSPGRRISAAFSPACCCSTHSIRRPRTAELDTEPSETERNAPS